MVGDGDLMMLQALICMVSSWSEQTSSEQNQVGVRERVNFGPLLTAVFISVILLDFSTSEGFLVLTVLLFLVKCRPRGSRDIIYFAGRRIAEVGVVGGLQSGRPQVCLLVGGGKRKMHNETKTNRKK